jgi:PAS domain S-box-containing protein
MDWIVPAQLVTLACSLILVFTYLSLYLQERRRYLAVWLASWSLYTVRSIFEIVVVIWGSHPLLTVMNLMSMVWSGALLFWGTRLFSGKRLNRGWLAVFVGGSLFVIAGMLFRDLSPWTIILTYSIAAFASVATGITLLRMRQVTGAARATAGWAFVLWGVHKADHPLLRPIPWVAPFGYLVGAVLGFVSAIGMILVFLEKTKKELKASEEKYRSIFENAVEGIFQATPEGRLLRVNPAYAGIYGYDSAEDLISDVKDIAQTYVNPEDYRQFVRLLADRGVVEGYERQRLRKDGTRIWVSSNARAVRGPTGEVLYFEGAVEDVTARREAENALLGSQFKLSEAMDLALLAYWEVDLTTGEFVFNDPFYALFGTTTEQEGGYRMPREEYARRFVHPDDMWVFRQAAEKRVASVEPEFLLDFEHRIIRRDGEVRHILARIRVSKDATGRVVRYHGANQDITKRRQAEVRLESTLDNLRKAIGGTIQAIVQVVEMRDPYTAGHQRRVADLARSIATEMDLAPQVIEGIRMAAAIHDIGKVAIPAEILSKPGKLNRNEFELIKDHPLTGYDILKDVEFPWPIAEIIYQHHERLDGSGYPRGLAGDDILLHARIIALADVVEAMASHRPFRPALGIAASLDEIEKHRGTLYDPDVVDACLRLFREKGYALTDREELLIQQVS